MNSKIKIGLALACLACLAMASGCLQGSPRLYPQPISDTAGVDAIKMFDTDKDGRLTGEELDQCPGLKAALARVDVSGSGEVTAQMITERIEEWKKSKIGRAMLSCKVTRNGRPLPGVEVALVPEKFLGPKMKVAKGLTNQDGMTMLSIELSDATDSPGVPPGFYRVEITKQGLNIPAKYNTNTTMGVEVAHDAEGIDSGFLEFKLDF